MNIYYSKEPIDVGNPTGDPITMDFMESPLKNPPDRIIYPTPTIKEVDFRSGKEKRRERRKQERNRKRLSK